MSMASLDYLTQTFGLAGRCAVVTGAGRGIGRAIAEALGAAGAKVCVHYHTSDAGAGEVVAALTAAGGEAFAVQADLTEPHGARTLADAVTQRWGRLDILVNNAGDIIQRSPIEDFSDDLIDRVIRLNFHSVVYLTRELVPLLRRGEGPSIINIGSIAVTIGSSGGAVVYGGTKGAVHAMTLSLARELAPAIRVNTLSPGVILTDFHRRHSTPERLEQIAGSTPLKRYGQAEDLAAPAVFLASEASAFITGHTLDVNGGLSMG